MANFRKIIGALEKQKEVAQTEVEKIDQAIAALSKLTRAGRGVRRRRRKMSAAARKRIGAAQRKRWAKLKRARPKQSAQS